MDVSVEANTANQPDNVEQLKAETLAEMAEFLVPDIQPKTTTNDMMPVLSSENIIKEEDTSQNDQKEELINTTENVQVQGIIENQAIPVSECDMVQVSEQNLQPQTEISVEQTIQHPEIAVEHVMAVEQSVEHTEMAVEHVQQTDVPVEHTEIPVQHAQENLDHVVQTEVNLDTAEVHIDNSDQVNLQNSEVNLEHADITIVQADESMEEASLEQVTLEQADQSIDSLDQSIASSTDIREEASDQSSEQIAQGSITEVYEEHITGETNIEDKLNSITEEAIKEEIKVNTEIKEDIVEVGKLVEYEEEEYEEAITDQETLVVVTSGDTQTKEIVVRTADGREGTVTVQQVTDENGQVYLVETVNNVLVMEEEDSQDNVEYMVQQQPPPNMPSHVLGRNIINPSVDPFRNGKAPPKPRLGVKIPYRNLTSQIVSKQEITAEILQRSKRNNREQPIGQNLFAKKLTQTLAKKLAPCKKALSESGSSNKRKEVETLNNSDLIAILEGDDGDAEVEQPEPPKETVKTVEMTKELEREIALKQLSELPDDPPPSIEKQEMKINKIIKDMKNRKAEEDKMIKKIEEIPVIRKAKKTKIPESLDDDLPKSSRFSSNVPLKTYTRKRKPSEEFVNTGIITANNKSPISDSNSTKKIDLPINTKSYITKSSRVIKKKIIWDPDEATPKKLMKGTEIPVKEKLLISSKKENEETTKKVKQEEGRKSEKADLIKKVEVVKKVPDSSSKQESSRNEKKFIVKTKEIRSETKLTNDKLAALKCKKRLTEVDKLLMDEGAVNMLYTLKGTEEDQHKKKPNKSLMSKTNELLNDLQTNTDKVSPKALRKKDGTPITIIKNPKKVASPVPSTISRQKSRDSIRSSLHSPPGSPGPVYMADASRIIRRHSSSSFSSEDENDEEKTKTKKPEVRRRKAEIIESPKKKIKKDETNNSSDHGDQDMQSKFNKLVENEENVNKYDKFKTFSVKKLDQLVQIILSPNVGNNVYINIEMMQELSAILKELEQDCECNLTVITSAGSAFMKGIKFKNLIAAKETTRKNQAKKLATNIRDFLLSLANFPKVLVAGVHGDIVGLGVTILPLFDMVVASDSATFSTPYAKLGCIAEGGSLLSLPHLSQNVLVSELLFSSRKLVSEEALKLGLVTKSLWPDKFQEEIINILKVMSNQSAQFMEGTKKQLRHRMIPDITAALNSETETLVQQWISSECQKNFSSN